MVPRISYASVEGCFIEFANSSTIGTLKRRVTQTLEGLKVCHWLETAHLPLQPVKGIFLMSRQDSCLCIALNVVTIAG